MKVSIIRHRLTFHVVGHLHEWVVNHKNMNFSEIFLSIRFRRARFADHFAKNKFLNLINK